MKLIVGLGNPGLEYQKTRHNLGFIIIDDLAKKFGVKWQTKPKWQANVAEVKLNNERILLVKPTSFYNLTGTVVRQIGDFYKIKYALDLLVIHDDLALEFGTIRVRQKGSDAGNNGIKSIIAQLGEDFWRIRVGTKNTLVGQIDSADFVLSKLTVDEQAALPIIYQKIETFVANFTQNKLTNDSQKV